MSSIFLAFYVVTALGILAWALVDTRRMLSFPAVLAGASLLYLIPQALGVTANPDLLPHGVRLEHGLEKALFMSVLCLVCGSWGYWAGGRHIIQRTEGHYSATVLFYWGLMLLALSTVGFWGLARIAGGFNEMLDGQGGLAGAWEGPAVVYGYLQRLIYPALMFLLMAAFLGPSTIKVAFVVFATLLPSALVVFLGRRSQAAMLFSVVVLVFYFRRRWLPPRWVVLSICLVAPVVVFLAPDYRAYRGLGRKATETMDISVSGKAKQILRGEASSEFINAVVVIAAYDSAGQFGYGAGFINDVLRNYIPKFLVGEELKSKLLLKVPDMDEITAGYGWQRAFYSVVPGPADVFREFWFFGSLVYFVIGFASRRLLDSAVCSSITAQGVYTAMFFVLLTFLSGRPTALLTYGIWAVVFVLPGLWLARRSPQPNLAKRGPRLRWQRSGRVLTPSSK